MRPTDAEIASATTTVLSLARELGVEPTGADVLHAGANISIRLVGTPLVARAVATVGRARHAGGRPDALRDLEVAGWLATRGGPVVPPSSTPPTGPYERNGHVIWLQQHVQVIGTGWDRPDLVGRPLRQVHELLARDDAPTLPRLPVWDDALRWIDAAPALSAHEQAWLRGIHARASADIESLGLPEQAIHGDAHPGNLLLTPQGPRWTDFEETGRWPVEWDLACVLNAAVVLGELVEERERIVRDYGRDPHDDRLDPFHVARTVMESAWIALTGDYRGVSARDRLARRLAWLRDRSAAS